MFLVLHQYFTSRDRLALGSQGQAGAGSAMFANITVDLIHGVLLFQG
jgi:hypothetical protein